MEEKAKQALARLKEKRPLVHNITNFVVMNYTANALLAMGASPVMAHAENEVQEMVGLAGSLVLNIGTLTDSWIDSMILAGKKANALSIPVVLDPVGAGATSFRTISAKKILEEVDVQVIRGNASEMISIGGGQEGTRGVDSTHGVDDASHFAVKTAHALDSVLAITGAVDFLTDGKRVVRIQNGHPLMSLVTGTGCTATACIGAFLAVEKDPLHAAAYALGFFGLAGEIAAEKTEEPGTYMVKLIDAIYSISPDEFAERIRMVEEK